MNSQCPTSIDKSMLEPAFILYNKIEQNQSKPYCCGIGTTNLNWG